jgi:hypothetical protein
VSVVSFIIPEFSFGIVPLLIQYAPRVRAPLYPALPSANVRACAALYTVCTSCAYPRRFLLHCSGTRCRLVSHVIQCSPRVRTRAASRSAFGYVLTAGLPCSSYCLHLVCVLATAFCSALASAKRDGMRARTSRPSLVPFTFSFSSKSQAFFFFGNVEFRV